MSRMHWSKALMVILFAALAFALPRVACASESDLLVGLKTLPLLVYKIEGNATVAVIYNPNDPNSKSEANSIKAIIDGGLEAPGGIKLSAIMVSINNLSKLSGAKIGMVTTGACTEDVSAAAAANGVLTMSSGQDCVRANRSVLGLVAEPRMIYYSISAAEAGNVRYSRSFIFVVRRI